MTDDTFDPTADAQANYALAISMMRLGMLLDGQRHPQPDEPVDIVLWADLVRARTMTAARMET